MCVWIYCSAVYIYIVYIIDGSRKKVHRKKAHRKQAQRKKAHRKKAHAEKTHKEKKRSRKKTQIQLYQQIITFVYCGISVSYNFKYENVCYLITNSLAFPAKERIQVKQQEYSNKNNQ